MHKIFVSLVMVIGLLTTGSAFAQTDPVSVPDVRGLSVPAAAAVLNTHGLLLGSQSNILWTVTAGYAQNTVGEQSVLPGETVAYGSSVDLTVLRSPNVALIYDDNDITLVNRSGATIEVSNVTFNAVETATPATYNALDLGLPFLEAEDCLQLWSVGRSEPKQVEGCRSTQWRSTNNTAHHFWTGLNGVTRFNVVQSGIERASCASAPAGAAPLTCEFYLATITTSEVTEYVYLAYTAQQLVIVNQSTDQWMPLQNVVVMTNGSSVPLGDPALFGNPPVIGIIQQLAPGQCLLFGAATTDTLPETCSILAHLDLAPETAFWRSEFYIDSTTVEGEYPCPAATDGVLTICVMPR